MASGDTVSVSDAIDRIGFGATQIRIVLIIGIFHGVEAMESYVLPLLSSVLQCSWYISHTEGALLSTFVFLGMLIGAIIFGIVSDCYGRRNLLIVSNSLVGFMALLSALSPTYTWVLFLRGITGFGMGGCTAIAATYVPELVPTQYRARAMGASHLMTGIFLLLGTLIAWLTITPLGWRVTLVLFALPCIATSFLLPFLPLSPRHLLISGKQEQAKELINSLLKANKKPQINGVIAMNSKMAVERRGHVGELFHRRLLKSTLMQMIVWFGAGFGHFGVVNLIVFLTATSHPCLQNSTRWSHVPKIDLDTSCCAHVSHGMFVTTAISIVGGSLGCAAVILLIDRVGRKISIAVTATVSGCLVICLDFCMPAGVKNFLFSLSTLNTVALLISLYIYTSESFPTNIRSTGVGCCNAATRLGAMLSAFPAQVLLPLIGSLATLSILSATFFVIAAIAICFPIEMSKKGLKQSIDDSSNEPNELSSIVDSSKKD